MSAKPQSKKPKIVADKAFFGHPHGLMTLFGTEMWERFSYYSMRAILLYYLIDTIANGGLGINKGIGESLVQIYSASVFLLSLVGGWMADRIWGARRATLYGGIVIMAGHICLAIPAVISAYIGICFVALGTGLLKPNISTMVGQLYADEDPRRDGGFSIFYMGINIGSLFSPIIVGLAKAYGGYHLGFSVAAIGMAFALIFFVQGHKYLNRNADDVPNPLSEREKKRFVLMILQLLAGLAVILLAMRYILQTGWAVAIINTITLLALLVPVVYFSIMYKSKKVTTNERLRLGAFLPLYIASAMFWMIFEQAASSMSSFAKYSTDLHAFGMTLQPEWFQSINPLGIVLLTPIFAGIWDRLGTNRPPTAYKLAFGLACAGLSFIWLGGFALTYIGGKAPWWVLAVTFIIQTIGELCLSPVGLAACTLLSPRAFRSQAMGIWLTCSAAGQAVAAQILKATGDAEPAHMFIGVGSSALVFTLILVAMGPWITRRMAIPAE